MPPKGCGGVGDSEHDLLIKEATEFEQWSALQLEPFFEQQNRFWKLWFAQRKEWRLAHEKWRANFAIPYPFTTLESNVAVLCDILNSSDPPIQAEGVKRTDEAAAHDIELQLDYYLRKNRWGRCQELLLRSTAIQGTTIPKTTWVNRKLTVEFMARDADVKEWKQRVKEAEVAVGVPAPLDPEEYEVWKDAVEAQTEGRLKVPSIPVSGKQQVTEYSGPWINRVPIWHLRYDPLIEDIEDQDCMIQRSVKPLKWVMDRVGKIFDEEQVGQAMTGWDGTKLAQWEQDQAQMMGASGEDVQSNPFWKKSVELWEVWRPKEEYPFQTILNRKAIINLDPTTSPYWYGSFPYFPIRNLPVPGHFHGLSELHQPEKLFYEADTLRNLRADALLLQVLPVFAKLKEVGMSELQRRIFPGAVLDLVRADAIKQLTAPNPGIADAFREDSTIKNEIDDAMGAYANIRGAPSTVGRVSATEAERRFSQAQVRQKQRAVRIEEDLQRMVGQMLYLSYQFHDPEVRKDIAGSDPLPSIPRERFLEALEMNFRFRGATKSLNRDLAAQQLVTYAKEFAPFIAPQEMREVMRRYLEVMGTKGIDQLLLPEVTQQQVQLAQAQIAQTLTPTVPQAPQNVTGAVADQMVESADAEAGAQPVPGNGAPASDQGAAGTPFSPQGT